MTSADEKIIIRNALICEATRHVATKTVNQTFLSVCVDYYTFCSPLYFQGDRQSPSREEWGENTPYWALMNSHPATENDRK